MKRYLLYFSLLIILLSACNPSFYQGYDDELYSSSRKVTNSSTEDNRYIISGINAGNNNAPTSSDYQSQGESYVVSSEPRTYLSIALGTPQLYAAFATPAYYDWWFYSPYYIPPYWIYYSTWYYDPIWNWYYPYYARWYYPWPYWRWLWYWDWYYPAWISVSPARERISHRPEMATLRQSIRNSGTIKRETLDQKPTQSLGSGSIENRRSITSTKPETSDPNTNTRPIRPTSGYGNASISSKTTPTLEETDRTEKPNSRITHTREINRNSSSSSGSISTPIHSNHRLELPSDRTSNRPNSYNQKPTSSPSGNENLSTPTKPADNYRQQIILPQNRDTESNSNSYRTISTERNNNTNDRGSQTTRRENAPTYHQSTPSYRTPPAGSSNPGGRNSIRSKE